MNTATRIERNKNTPREVLALVDTARVNGCWIYHEKSQHFYTPEEFEEKWHTVALIDNKANNLKDFKIVNPMYAVRLSARWIDIANQRNQEILKKLEYYSGEFKKKA